MDISKLNRLIIFTFIFVCFSCHNRQKECDCEKTIGITSSIILSSLEARNNLKGLKIEHICDGKKIEDIKYEYKYNIGSKIKIKITRTKDLKRTDTIKFTFKNGKIIVLYDFIVVPNYAGSNNKYFIGCNTEYCKINEQDSIFIRDWIYL